jgi:hypothetical protein
MRPRPRMRASLAAAMIVLTAGCGSVQAARGPAPAVSRPSPPLAASLATGTTAWAVLPMGAPAGPNQFWELFRLRAGLARWTLATPPDVATNGAVILASPGGTTLAAGVRPSLHLDFSPVTETTDDGAAWTAWPPHPGLAEVPSALAAGAGGRLLALSRDGQVQQSVPHGTTWTRLTTTRALAASVPGGSCRLTALTAVAYTPSGAPLLGGDCARPGTAGIFADRDGAWQAAGPVLPAAVAALPVQVLRLAAAGPRNVALLVAGRGPRAVLLAAWSSSGPGRTWTTSASLPVPAAGVTSTAIGSRGEVAVTLPGGRAADITSPGGGAWRSLPELPANHAVTLAFTPGGLSALTAAGSDLTTWQLDSKHRSWARTQATKIPIQYGSSS